MDQEQQGQSGAQQNTQQMPPVEPQNNSSAPQQLSTASTNRTLMGVLSYLGILVFVPLFVSKDDSFVKFHVRQGLVVFSIEVIIWVLGMMFYGFWFIANILNLATIVLSIIGIINVVGNKEKELPVVGQFSKHFNV
jgi:uncharacterized membrane protein